MNERVEYTYAYFMHIINVWASGVSPPQPPTFLLVSPPLDQSLNGGYRRGCEVDNSHSIELF